MEKYSYDSGSSNSKSVFLKQVNNFSDLLFNYYFKDNGKDAKVLNYYGSDNQHKQILYGELVNCLENDNNFIFAAVDLNVPANKEIDILLLSLRNQFNEKYGIAFPSFDIAYLVFMQRTDLNFTRNNKNLPFNKGKSPINYIIKETGSIPEKGLIPVLSNIFEKPGSPYKNWWRTRGRIELSNILLLNNREVLEMLAFVLIKDFVDFLSKSGKYPVIFFNSYKPLNEDNNGYYLCVTDELMKKWVRKSNNILYVLTTREKIDWDEKSDEWNQIKKISVDDSLNGNYSGSIENSEIPDNDLRDYIWKECGEDRLLLNLSADIYKELKNKKNGIPVNDDFKNFRVDYFKILLSVLDKSEIEAFMLLSAVKRWDNIIFKMIMQRLRPGLKADLDSLKRFSFVTETNIAGVYKTKKFIRELFLKMFDKGELDLLNKFLFDFYNAQLSSADFKNLSDKDKNNFDNAFHYAKFITDIIKFSNWFFKYGRILKENGHLRFILPYLTEYTGILDKNKINDNKKYVDIIFNVGVYFKETGKYKDAESYLTKALKLLESLYGEESEEAIECLVNLADVLFFTGDYSKAEKLYLRAIVILDPMKTKTGTFSIVSLINVAILFARQKKFDEAIKLFEKTLKIRLKSHGEGHPEVDKIYTNIANIEFDRKNYSKAEKLYRKILESKISYFGDRHPEIGKAKINLGNVLIEMNNFKEAAFLYENAKDIFEEFCGNEHPDTAMTLNNLAYLHYVMENFDTSKFFYLQALDIYEKILGDKHPDTAILYNNIGKLFTKMKNFSEAEKYLKNSFEIKINHFGFDNPETGESYDSLAELYEASGNQKEALHYLKKLEKMQKDNLPNNSEELELTRRRISNLVNI